MDRQQGPTKSWGTNAVRQLKLVIPGALGVYYLGIVEAFLQTLHGLNGSLARYVLEGQAGRMGSEFNCIPFRTGAFTAGGLGLTTVALFFYILLLPLTTGEEPDASHFSRSIGPKLTLESSTVHGVNHPYFPQPFQCVCRY